MTTYRYTDIYDVPIYTKLYTPKGSVTPMQCIYDYTVQGVTLFVYIYSINLTHELPICIGNRIYKF